MTQELFVRRVGRVVSVVPINSQYSIAGVSESASKRISQNLKGICETCELRGDICRKVGGVANNGAILELWNGNPPVTHEKCRLPGQVVVMPAGVEIEPLPPLS